MLVPNRNYSSPSYRYGFQGQEKDDEVKGSGNSLNYKYRMHDPRIGRFFAADPLEGKYPWYTPYQFSGNKVIHMVELEGLEEGATVTQEENGDFTDENGEKLKEGQKRNYQDWSNLYRVTTRDYIFHEGKEEYTTAGWYKEGDYEKTQMDFENGQVLMPLGFWEKFPVWINDNRAHLGFRVDDKGYMMSWGNQDGLPGVRNKAFMPFPDPTMIFGGGGGTVKGIKLAGAGRSIWSIGAMRNSFRNAIGHFNKHGHEFGFTKAKEYIKAVHKFISNVPAGTKIKMTSASDVIMYSPKSNTFIAMKINGTPRTMFKPNLIHINQKRTDEGKDIFNNLSEWWDSKPALKNKEWITE